MAVESEHAVAILTEIFENGVKSDLITLVAGVGGRRIPIHRYILMANSKYFTASSGSNFVEADENEFILDETDGPTLKALVDFCYTGRIDLTEENVTKHLAIASGVELHLLETKCWRFLTDGLSVNNAVRTLMIADLYSCHKLRQKAFNLVCEMFDKLLPSHIDGLDNRMWEEILKRDDVRGGEQFILERLLDWFQNDEDERRQHMAELLKLIRLPLIPTQYLDGDTIQIIYKRFDCLELLLAEKRRRIVYPTPNAGTRRHMSIFCLFKQVEDGTLKYSVKIERYMYELYEFERVGEIELGQRRYSEAILHENKVYILGGLLDGLTSKSVSVYDLSSGRKRDLPEMNSARSDFATILLGKLIYVFGGSNTSHEEFSSCERFDLETETWEELSPMRTARSCASATALDGFIYVAGGYNRKDVEMFDPQNDEWTYIAIVERLSVCSFHMGESFVCDGKFYVDRKIRFVDNSLSEGIESPEVTEDLTSAVVIDGIIYVVGRKGQFGEMKIDKNGCLFLGMVPPKHSGNRVWKHQLHYY